MPGERQATALARGWCKVANMVVVLSFIPNFLLRVLFIGL